MNLPDVRRKLDRLNKQIIGRLADRSRFLLSAAIYHPNAIPIDGPHTTFLDHALRGLERYHATLGRYSYPDQNPLHNDMVLPSPVRRVVLMESLPAVDYPIQQKVIEHYVALLPDVCPSGDDPQNYGETAYVDADCIVLMHERINMGRYVAHIKAEQTPGILDDVPDPARLRENLMDRQREQEVITAAQAVAERQDLDPNIIARAFRWMIDETLNVEVRFLEQLRQPSRLGREHLLNHVMNARQC